MYDRVHDGKELLGNKKILKDQTVRMYLENKKILKDRYEAERSGDIQLFKDQTKYLAPLIKSQEETAKATQDKIVASQDVTSNALVPFTSELKRRNDQVDTLQALPFYQAQIEQQLPIAESMPEKKATPLQDLYYLDKDLNTTDIENLEDMNLELPSIVSASGTHDAVLEQIKSENKSIGQYLGKGAAGKKVSEQEKEIYSLRRETLEKYKPIIKDIKSSQKYKGKSISGQGLRKTNVIYYNNPQELCERLLLLDAAKQAGNNGVNNDITSILDELLKIGKIDKSTYDKLFKNIFLV